MREAKGLAHLAERWEGAKPAERANAQSYIIELCDALGVERPRPAGSGYEFEFPIRVANRDGSESPNFIDCYKRDHFVLEAKDYAAGSSNELLLRKAYGQARTYANNDPSGVAPPYILVLDVAQTLIVWDRWSGTYGGFPAGRWIDLTSLATRPEDVALLRDIWNDPAARDPRLHAQVVTKEIAAHLGELAARLERQGYAQERVSKFLMRCVFTMFAEDVHLLEDEPFRHLLDDIAMADPKEFKPGAEELWRAMDEGRRFGFRKLLRFNGHFFKNADALPLERDELAILLEATRADWSKVEPTIFGTLLVRALDPVERHRLGAEFTPPAFIERLVKPTIEEPLRIAWAAVQAEVLQLREAGRPRDLRAAEQRLRAFHEWLRTVRVLDPACGSGNFLYVAMHAIKRIELEVLNELAAVTKAPELRFHEVDPSQFWGIEIKAWAREIAELTLWIGFHQFWRQHHAVQPEEPLLRDTGTLDHRDAVLTSTQVVEDPRRAEPDPTPRVPHPITGRLVPDPERRRPYHVHEGAHAAAWPDADFIIGNPPYIGGTEMRETLGGGYVDALRAAYPDLPDGADFVMYWWDKAARAVHSGRTMRAGFITTNSIVQVRNRSIVAAAAAKGVRVTWAVADHPWVDDADGAAVRVAMTVVAQNPTAATLVTVDERAQETGAVTVARLNVDLTVNADVPSAAAVPLLANASLSFAGFQLFGAGFILEATEAERLLQADPRYSEVIRPYLNGRDLTARPRGVYVIDFGLRDEGQAREFPVLYDIVRDRVKPERDANRRASLSRHWWRFGYPRGELREALDGLPRYIATPETAKHRFFTFLDACVAADNMLTVIATDEAYVLGILSSAIHVTWALVAGGRLGVGNDPRYQKTLCFDPFPFPDATPAQQVLIGSVAERLDQHRKAALARDERVTITRMYNVVDALRAGVELSPAEREIHTLAACGVLRDLHDELDHLVAEAYGWPWPDSKPALLERLVTLHDRRVEEEKGGEVRWVRPSYQRPRFGPTLGGAEQLLGLDDGVPLTTPATALPWPRDAVGQIAAIRQLAATTPLSVDEAVQRFNSAPRSIVARHLETLAILGEVQALGDGRYGVPLGAY